VTGFVVTLGGIGLLLGLVRASPSIWMFVPGLLLAVMDINRDQRRQVVDKVRELVGEDLTGKRVGLLGLAFKPNTDDMREAPSRVVIEQLFEHGATVHAYDPVAMKEARRIYAGESRIQFADTPMAALEGCDALLIVTEWKEFRSPDFAGIKQRLKQPLVFDGRNLYDPNTVTDAGLEYFSIGRG